MLQSPQKIKWFLVTVIVGLLPVISRGLFSLFTSNNISPFVASDFIAFGFVLHISILNQIEHLNTTEQWKSVHQITSSIFIFLYGGLTFVLLSYEADSTKIDINIVKYSAISISVVSLVMTYTIFDRLVFNRGEEICLQTQ
ncbi:hypothetical protein KY46_00855 [Photobacterium halotolerans]|uniref:Uncharacterized protein n=2 Tax=Photobacterium halotolerans TaxID=265726 RepID=A0A0F5VGV4_9GAMM|nr:hypothetical protein KY46_00855 [Photobacterium halotolerans]